MGANRDRDVMRTMFHFDETHASILDRTGHLQKSAWAEDPPSRCRRFVTNVRVGEADAPGEYEVVSYLFLERSRGDNPDNERLTAGRRDIWREAVEPRSLPLIPMVPTSGDATARCAAVGAGLPHGMEPS